MEPIGLRPKAIVFDLGKVLLDFDYSIAARRIAAHCAMPADEINQFIAQSPLLFRYETGLMTTLEFFNEVSTLTGFHGELDKFASFFGDIFTPIEPMVRLHAELRERGMPTFIFSNTNDLAIGHVRRNFPFFANFDGHIFSYEHQAMKPDARLYEVVERQAQRQQAEILYLDDRPENIEAGARRGWQVILQETPQKSRAAVQKLGLLD